jgi:hypothetical protein
MVISSGYFALSHFADHSAQGLLHNLIVRNQAFATHGFSMTLPARKVNLGWYELGTK